MGLFDMMGKLNDLKKQVEETKRMLDDIPVELVFANGKVKITANASRKIEAISIDPGFYQSASKEEMESLLVKSINEILGKAREIEERELKKVAGGMLPGLGL